MGRIRATPLFAAALALAGCGAWGDELFCGDEGCEWSPGAWSRVAALANPPPPPPDRTNRWADDPVVAQLGQRFYFDTAFSGPSRMMDTLRRPTTVGRAPVGQPSRVSCATCHDLSSGGVDVSSQPANVSIGAGVTDVNALPTLNAAYHATVFWNGRVDSLWALNLVVAESDTTMNGNRLQTAHVLAERYADAVEASFSSVMPVNWRARAAGLPPAGKPGATEGCQAGSATEPAMDAYDCLPESERALATTLLVVWAKAIATYERRLVSRDSAFDRWVAAGPRSSLISSAAQRGARLFVGKAACVDCHNGPLLSDDGFHDMGVPQRGPAVPTVAQCPAGTPCDCVAGKNCLPWGAYNGLAWRRDTGPRWYPILDAWTDDPAARAHAAPPQPFDERLRGAWRTPSLRDVALTAPYMHDGAFATLGEVIAHYNDGGRASRGEAVGRPAVQLAPLQLTAGEAADLTAFLGTLTGAALPADLLIATPATPDAGAPEDAMRPDGGDAKSDADAAAPAEAGPAAAVPANVFQSFKTHGCVNCHVPGAPGPALDTPVHAYATLVGVPSSAVGCTDRVRVVRGASSKSYLLAKLTAKTPPCGERMPLGAAAVPAAVIDDITRWIDALPP